MLIQALRHLTAGLLYGCGLFLNALTYSRGISAILHFHSLLLLCIALLPLISVLLPASSPCPCHTSPIYDLALLMIFVFSFSWRPQLEVPVQAGTQIGEQVSPQLRSIGLPRDGSTTSQCLVA